MSLTTGLSFLVLAFLPWSCIGNSGRRMLHSLRKYFTRATDLHVYPRKDLGIGQRALDLGFKALGLDRGLASVSRKMASS